MITFRLQFVVAVKLYYIIGLCVGKRVREQEGHKLKRLETSGLIFNTVMILTHTSSIAVEMTMLVCVSVHHFGPQQLLIY